jgi:hypothetical protein
VNVTVLPFALGEHEGVVVLEQGDDPSVPRVELSVRRTDDQKGKSKSSYRAVTALFHQARLHRITLSRLIPKVLN